ncbi:MAG TPA: hypothetical protein VI589_06565 [Vicinamibacteria bacterium]
MNKPRALLVLLALGQLTCNQAIMTAPTNSTLDMFINPSIIAANGGVAIVSVLVIEPAGTPVPDGTVVQFFTNLGDIPEQGKTNDGVVRVNLRATGRSGEAAITAVSGGAGGSVSTTTTSTLAGGGSVPFFAAGIGTASGTVTIGNLAANSVLVTADPSRITTSRSSQITATVFDTTGNPLPGVPVYFDVSVGADNNFMDSGGRPRFTDSSGRAFDVLRTRELAPASTTVRARVPASGGSGEGSTAFLQGEVTVEIN